MLGSVAPIVAAVVLLVLAGAFGVPLALRGVGALRRLLSYRHRWLEAVGVLEAVETERASLARELDLVRRDVELFRGELADAESRATAATGALTDVRAQAAQAADERLRVAAERGSAARIERAERAHAQLMARVERVRLDAERLT